MAGEAVTSPWWLAAGLSPPVRPGGDQGASSSPSPQPDRACRSRWCGARPRREVSSWVPVDSLFNCH